MRCANAATPPPTACWRSRSCWTARTASSPARRCGRSACPSKPDYPLDDILDDLADEAEQALGRLKGEQRELDEDVEAAISRAIKKASQRIWGRRPVVETTVLRL